MASEHSVVPQAWSPDGQPLAFVGEQAMTGLSIGLLPIRSRRQPRRLLHTPVLVMEPTFSPDGRWLAYALNESGRYEVYGRVVLQFSRSYVQTIDLARHQ